MSPAEILSLVVTLIGVCSFATIFTILYKSYATSSIAEITSGKRDVELMDEVIYEQKDSVKKKRKITNRIKTIVFCIFLLIVVPIFVFAIINKIQGNTTMIGDKTVMVVASGSMSYKDEGNKYVNDVNLTIQYNMDNQFDQYDIIVLEKVTSPEDLHLYDVVAFKAKDGSNIIHRIVKIEIKNGVYTYTTQGDARPKEDGQNPKFEDIIGVYTNKRIKSVGMFIMFFQSYAGIITVLSLLYCMFMIDKFNNNILKSENKRLEQLENAIGYKNDSEFGDIKSEFIETIYYKGFAYRFNESGFIEKEEINEEPLCERSNEVIVKVIEEEQNTITEEINLNEVDGEKEND